MATKKTNNKPMSLFDPSAMNAGFNMAYKAEIANAPASNANIATSNAQFFSSMMDQNTKRFQNYLKKQEKEEEEEKEAIKNRAKPFTDGTLTDIQSESYMTHLNKLEKERVDNDLDKKGNEKKLLKWEQKYNRFLNGAQSTKNTLTSIVTMVNAKEHIANGMTKKDRRALMAIGDLHTGEKTQDLSATQVIGDDGVVSYTIQDGANPSYSITEQDLKTLVPIKDNKVKADVQALFNDISTSSASGEFEGDDVFDKQQNTYNSIIDLIDGSDNSQNAYSTLLDGKFGGMSESFLDAMKDPKSEVFATLLATLEDQDLITKFDKKIGEQVGDNYTYAADGELTPEDFSKKADPDGENLVKFMDAIKKDSQAGKPLVAAYLSNVAASQEHEIAKSKRKKKEGNTYKDSEAVRVMKSTSLKLAQPTPPPTIKIGRITYKREKYKEERHGEGDGNVAVGSYVYSVQFAPEGDNVEGETRFYTPYDLSNEFPGNDYNSKITQSSLLGASISPTPAAPPKKGWWE